MNNSTPRFLERRCDIVRLIFAEFDKLEFAERLGTVIALPHEVGVATKQRLRLGV